MNVAQTAKRFHKETDRLTNQVPPVEATVKKVPDIYKVK